MRAADALSVRSCKLPKGCLPLPRGTRHRGRYQALRSEPPVRCVHLDGIFPPPLPAAALYGKDGAAFRPAVSSAGHSARSIAGHGRKKSPLPG